jgi:hypothetical protein
MSSSPSRSVTFPVVGPRGVAFAEVHVERLAALDRSERFAIAPGFPDVIDILLDARADDDAARRLDGVTVVFGGDRFSGRSYGLALAIADQRARTTGAPDSPVIATGVIPARGRGVIAAVEGFAAKSEAVLDHVATSTVAPTFAFPRENWDTAPPELRARLELAQSSGALTLLPCANVGDAARLWRVVDRRRRRRHATLTAMLATLLLIAGTWAWWYASLTPARACETAIGAIPETGAAPELVARAARACDQAVARFPDNGRMQFLLGQVRAYDGSEMRAAQAWHRSAELGDMDGMAAHGRYLWHSAQNNGAQRTEARRWLVQAAAAGSPDAADDLGYMAIDAGKAREAQQWLARARKLREAREEP